MHEPKATFTCQAVPTGWRVFRSTEDRLWATRERPYDEAEEQAGAWRTVDGDNELELCRAIAEQESRAELASSS
ncbi:hypothetical protein GCM10022226_31430 [Sphaerisporangium flaviroseum]|uniref:Uncharacterized protein n=1 Tax=Sphaerisporangium flaviroseum TaxID=509199 RepID=A0ABP7I0J4_9ACTN